MTPPAGARNRSGWRSICFSALQSREPDVFSNEDLPTFRLLAGKKTFNIDLPEGTTVRQSVYAVVDECPVLHPHWLDDAGDIHAHVHIFVNGHDVQNLERGADSPLQTGDVLDFFPPVGGG